MDAGRADARADADGVVIVQARTGSRRLPGKVLAPIGGRPMVLHVLERAAAIGPPVVLATSDDPGDDELAALVRAAGHAVSRGSRDDVLARFIGALPEGARHVVRVTADCPLFDPAVGRAVLAILRECRVDYVTNALVPTFPDGLDCSAVTASALRVAGREATLRSDREHVMPFIWRQPERFRILNLAHQPDLGSERWTVDEESDLAFVRLVHERIAQSAPAEPTSMYAVLEVLERHPELRLAQAAAVRDAGYAYSLQQDQDLARGQKKQA